MTGLNEKAYPRSYVISTSQSLGSFPNCLGIKMKRTFIAIVLVVTASTAFAQSTRGVASIAQPANNSLQLPSSHSAGLPTGRWVPPYSGPTPARTPAQVYQQTVHAEVDGQLAHLNSMAAAARH
ncbi:UNVERIFIED_ORG: hypothetical protein BDU10_5597 [Burkholderia sp. CF145]